MAPPEKGQWATYADYYEKLIPEMQARVRVGMTPEQIAALEKARADRLNYGHFTPCSTIRRR